MKKIHLITRNIIRNIRKDTNGCKVLFLCSETRVN
nr:MAG TPA: hypothetical protein [Caudoviricetes sp.]